MTDVLHLLFQEVLGFRQNTGRPANRPLQQNHKTCRLFGIRTCNTSQPRKSATPIWSGRSGASGADRRVVGLVLMLVVCSDPLRLQDGTARELLDRVAHLNGSYIGSGVQRRPVLRPVMWWSWKGSDRRTAQPGGGYLRSRIKTTSLVVVPRATASCLPSGDQLKQKI